MSAKVHILLTTPQTIGIDVTHPIGNISTLLNSLDPERIGIEFCCLDEGTSIDLIIEFGGPTALVSSRIFTAALVRSETLFGYDCSLVKTGDKTPKREETTSIEVEPEMMFLPSGKEIAISVPLLDVVPSIFRQAHIYGSNICYRIDLLKTKGNKEHARALVPALAELRMGSLIHSSIEESVSSAFELAKTGGWLAHEQICIRKSTLAKDQAWIEALIKRHLEETAKFLGDELLPLRWGLKAADPAALTLQEFIGRLRNIDYLSRVFEQMVPSEPDQCLLVTSLESERKLMEGCPSNDYAFVSYAHINRKFATELLSMLDNVGIAYWFDDSIESGAVWDVKLEDRIRNCGVFIACVSDEYQLSKYCRREIKFADLLDKKILPVSATKWMWGQGLQMMFQELQVTPMDRKDDFVDICTIIQSIAPQLFGKNKRLSEDARSK